MENIISPFYTQQARWPDRHRGPIVVQPRSKETTNEDMFKAQPLYQGNLVPMGADDDSWAVPKLAIGAGIGGLTGYIILAHMKQSAPIVAALVGAMAGVAIASLAKKA